ncbi:uncharacterized protein RJT20DRAFT_30729 [Scheffersomyces xylosifermentans]|uniref:uncharacterized protein n=1 Tax=Scheffersomyces xylosifermentans TaxID=1304137 RepID=UPI00315CF87C
MFTVSYSLSLLVRIACSNRERKVGERVRGSWLPNPLHSDTLDLGSTPENGFMQTSEMALSRQSVCSCTLATDFVFASQHGGTWGVLVILS